MDFIFQYNKEDAPSSLSVTLESGNTITLLSEDCSVPVYFHTVFKLARLRYDDLQKQNAQQNNGFVYKDWLYEVIYEGEEAPASNQRINKHLSRFTQLLTQQCAPLQCSTPKLFTSKKTAEGVLVRFEPKNVQFTEQNALQNSEYDSDVSSPLTPNTIDKSKVHTLPSTVKDNLVNQEHSMSRESLPPSLDVSHLKPKEIRPPKTSLITHKRFYATAASIFALTFVLGIASNTVFQQDLSRTTSWSGQLGNERNTPVDSNMFLDANSNKHKVLSSRARLERLDAKNAKNTLEDASNNGLVMIANAQRVKQYEEQYKALPDDQRNTLAAKKVALFIAISDDNLVEATDILKNLKNRKGIAKSWHRTHSALVFSKLQEWKNVADLLSSYTTASLTAHEVVLLKTAYLKLGNYEQLAVLNDRYLALLNTQKEQNNNAFIASAINVLSLDASDYNSYQSAVTTLNAVDVSKLTQGSNTLMNEYLSNVIPTVLSKAYLHLGQVEQLETTVFSQYNALLQTLPALPK